MSSLMFSNKYDFSSKIDFWPFLKLQKMEFGRKNFCEIDLSDVMSFFGLDFFNFFWPTVFLL